MIAYLLINRVNGKVYIGQTSSSLRLRWQMHKADARYGRLATISKAIRKYGEDAFDCHEMANNLDSSAADNLERVLILAFQTRNPLFGYNVALGGKVSRGWKASAETRQKQSLAKLGKKRAPRSPEHCQNISKAKLGHSVSAETRLKISQSLKERNQNV